MVGNPHIISSAHGNTSGPAYAHMAVLLANETAPGHDAVPAGSNILLKNEPCPACSQNGKLLVIATNQKFDSFG